MLEDYLGKTLIATSKTSIKCIETSEEFSYPKWIKPKIIRRAFNNKSKLIPVLRGDSIGFKWSETDINMKDNKSDNKKSTKDDTINLIHNSFDLKPEYLKMSEDKWKVLVRCSLRGLNVLIVGEAGEGKTLSAYALKDALQKPFFYINMGNTQDAQTALIGKTHLSKETGTYFSESYFVKAIQTPGAVILLDEITRASFDAMNILITVLDKKQRYLRITDDPDSPTIKVANGVSFIATANIGFKYSGTVRLDHAILDRFIKVEVDSLTSNERLDLITNLYGNKNKNVHKSICNISHDLSVNLNSTDAQISVCPSTRQVLEMAEFIEDGFSLSETLNVILYPMFEIEERVFVRTVVQKYDVQIKDEDGLLKTPAIKSKEPPNWD